MPLAIQPSFAKGEIAPSLYGRVDIAAYAVALRRAKNAIVHAYGGVSNRAGLQFIGPVNDHTYAPHLIPFEFNVQDTYVLEFGDFYMRVIRNDAFVLETPITITGATQANPVVISAVNTYSDGDEVDIAGVVGMTEINNKRFTVNNATGTTFELTDQVTGANIDGIGFTAYTSGGTAARVYSIPTPYAIADVHELKYVQSADVMTLTHDDYDPRELSRTDHDAWTLGLIEFNPTQDHPTGLSVTAGTTGAVTERYKVTAINQDGEESLSALNSVGISITGATQADPVVLSVASHPYADADEIEINGVVGMTQLNGRRFRVANQTGTTLELQDVNGVDVDGTGYDAWSSAGTINAVFDSITNGAATKDNDLAWTAVAGAVRYAVYYRENGIYGLVGETETTSFTDSNITADTDIGPPQYSEPFFGEGVNSPGAAGFFEQRRVFGGSNGKPDTSYYSKTGDISNFTKSTPSQLDDAITATLASQQVNKIRHFVPVNDLLILTSGAEWKVSAGTDAGFSIETLRQKPQSSWGSSERIPIVSGNTTLFVQSNDSIVRSIGFSLQIDGYAGTDLSILANHLLQRNVIVDWAYSRYPDPIVYMIRDDGQVLCMTFDQDQEVIAWTTWDTQGKFEDVTAIQSSPSEKDESGYFVVRRIVNGNVVRYIEKVHSRNFKDVRDCFFVDSGLSLDEPVDITGITLADPVVITTAGHSFVNGDEVDIYDIEWQTSFDDLDNEVEPELADGAPQLNTRRFIVANATGTTFELTDEDGDVDGTAYAAYIDGGTARKAVTTVSGLDHLIGQEVSVLADGNVIFDSVVSATGTLTFPRKFSRYHIGLKYVTDIETLNIEGPRGTIQGVMKKVSKVVTRVERTRGMFVGPTKDELAEAKFRENEAMGDPTELKTGDVETYTPPEWNVGGRVLHRQRYPLPMTILAVVPDLEVGDR